MEEPSALAADSRHHWLTVAAGLHHDPARDVYFHRRGPVLRGGVARGMAEAEEGRHAVRALVVRPPAGAPA